MKTFKIFSTAALALMMAACSSEDTAQNNSPAQQGQKVPFSATIAAPGSGAGTRTEYTEVTTGDAAGTINVAWKTGDEIALIHDGKADVVKVETVNADGSATIAGDITVGTDGEAVEVCYPAAAWEWNDEVKGAMKNADYIAKTVAQDGTLKYIQDNLDVRMGAGKLKVDGKKATLSANVKLDSQIAIWKLTLQDDAETPAALKATQVIVKVDEPTATIARTTTLSTPTSTVYLAMDMINEENLTIEATVGEDTYSYTNEVTSLERGKYYQRTVTMAKAATDLSKLTADYTVKNGETLTGTLNGETQPYKITIADGATITLDGVTINGISSSDVKWAGITCLGDATIILKDGSKNTVKGFYEEYPGIQAGPTGKTLVIKGEDQGTGSLDASPYDVKSDHCYGAGIGGGLDISCGDINIQGGVITVTGGYGAAGIGVGEGYKGGNVSCGTITISGGNVTATGGYGAAGIGGGYAYDYGVTCGAITISGGTVTAAGGDNAAGIGSGESYSGKPNTCGDITVTADVTSVTATKGKNATNSIGAGNSGTCGTVTIGGDATTYAAGVAESPFVYPTPSVALSAVTSTDYLGWRICSDGKAYAATGPLPTGVTAVAMIVYVGRNNGEDAPYNHGLALALSDANGGTACKWSTSETKVHTYNTTSNSNFAIESGLQYNATHNSDTYPAFQAAIANNGTAAPTGCSSWFLASGYQWLELIGAAGLSNLGLWENDNYWLSTEYDAKNAWTFGTYSGGCSSGGKGFDRRVRACLAF